MQCNGKRPDGALSVTWAGTGGRKAQNIFRDVHFVGLYCLANLFLNVRNQGRLCLIRPALLLLNSTLRMLEKTVPTILRELPKAHCNNCRPERRQLTII